MPAYPSSSSWKWSTWRMSSTPFCRTENPAELGVTAPSREGFLYNVPPIAKNYRRRWVCDSFSISLPLYQKTSKDNAVRGLHVNFTNKPKNHEIKCIKTYNVRFVTGWCGRHPARAPTGARTAHQYRISTRAATATEVYTFGTPSGGKGCSCMYYHLYH